MYNRMRDLGVLHLSGTGVLGGLGVMAKNSDAPRLELLRILPLSTFYHRAAYSGIRCVHRGIQNPSPHSAT